MTSIDIWNNKCFINTFQDYVLLQIAEMSIILLEASLDASQSSSHIFIALINELRNFISFHIHLDDLYTTDDQYLHNDEGDDYYCAQLS